jgi:prepilin-type N-terminal cleavage/methylation domain-containing protein
MNKIVTRRAAFTLVELLVVIAIIALLASLLLLAVQNVRDKGRELDCYNDLFGLNIAITDFTTGSGGRLGALGYLPSKLDPSGGDLASQTFLAKLFPQTGGKLNLPPAQLEGDQVMVFLLGGPNGKGWCLSNPADPTTGTDRTVFYSFKPDRLVDVAQNGYSSYLDCYGTPIAYFSPYQWTPNGWGPVGCGPDCPRLGVVPYADVNRTSWQLISAGKNKSFGGSGAIWTYATATTVYPPGSAGADDMSNFSRFRLGATQR